MAIDQQVISRNELLDRTRALLPRFKERGLDTEKARQISEATIVDLAEAGLLRIPNPQRYGGYEHDIDLVFQVAMEIGRSCGATAWCYAVWSIHNWMIGHWPQQAQDEYFAEGPDTLSSSAFAPTGALEPAEGGYVLKGHWQFSSGSDGATWALLGAMAPEGVRMVLVPRSDYEIVDTWFVSGLSGTGSKDIHVESAFVPSHRVSAIMSPVVDPAAFELHGRASYRLPPMSFLPFTLCSPLVGMAQGAIEEMVERLRGKTGPGRTAESVAIQLRLAESSAEVDAARLIVKSRTAKLIEGAAREERPSEMEQATIRRDYSYVARLCVSAVNRLFDASGGHSLYESEAMQRFHRDIHAGSHQVALYWDPIAEAYGRALLGLPALPPVR